MKKSIISDYSNKPVEVNAEKIGRDYMRGGIKYRGYYDCLKCKNASWYDDDYCNMQKIHFIYPENNGRTKVYCENYERDKQA